MCKLLHASRGSRDKGLQVAVVRIGICITHRPCILVSTCHSGPMVADVACRGGGDSAGASIAV
jgi:hypothetical protein